MVFKLSSLTQKITRSRPNKSGTPNLLEGGCISLCTRVIFQSTRATKWIHLRANLRVESTRTITSAEHIQDDPANAEGEHRAKSS